MKCEVCNYKEVIDGIDLIKCVLTKEEHEQSFDCNCDYIRVRRDNETRLLNEQAAAVEVMAKLKDRLSVPRPNLEYVYRALHEIREEVDSNKLEELIQYLEGFL
jgi:hypothetical protein